MMNGSRCPTALGWLLLSLVAMLSVLSCHQTTAPADTKAPPRLALAITHVTLIDPIRGAQPDVTIVLEGDHIAEVGPSAAQTVPAGAAMYDASGRFAVPGFWDAHVHVSQIGVDSIGLLVANGVTGVRDMGSAFRDIVHWREMRAAGKLVPRVFSPGPKLDQGHEEEMDRWVVSSPGEARRTVARLKEIGVDFIKVHSGLSRPVYDAVADESRKEGLFFAGHADGEYPPLHAVAAGQRTIEHGRGMISCSQQQRELLRANPALSLLADSLLAGSCGQEPDVEQILPAMARAGVWFTPTLVSWRGRVLARDAIARLDGIHYVPRALEERWGEPVPPFPPAALEILAAYGPLTARADRAGVHLLTGCDLGDSFVVPGFALHDEMQLFVEAGVPPLAAIRSATLEPARALGVDAKVGSIERGKVADIVLLGADPLADIRNTRRIVAVVLNGRLLTAEYLKALIEPLHRSN